MGLSESCLAQASPGISTQLRESRPQQKRGKHMEHGRRSGTALGAALLRAAHLILDGDPKLLSEELGMLLAGVPDLTALRATMEAFHEEAARVVGEAHAASVLRAV